MGRDAKEVLAEAAHLLRFGDADGAVTTPIKPEQLLVPRRQEDRTDDLWTVWNVVQENSIKGGLRGVSRDETGRPRRSTSRPINGIDQDIKLNKALWLVGERMASLIRNRNGFDRLASRTVCMRGALRRPAASFPVGLRQIRHKRGGHKHASLLVD